MASAAGSGSGGATLPVGSASQTAEATKAPLRRRSAPSRPRGRDEQPPDESGIDVLPSGARRVRVYAGVDRVTGRQLILGEVVAADTPDIDAVAAAVRDRIRAEVAEKRHPRTNATIAVLVDRYLDRWAGSDSFRATLRGYARNHVRPLIGEDKIREADDDLIESLYEKLLRCRGHCSGAPLVEHRTEAAHDCDERCRPHECTPLANSTVRHIHNLLSGAFRKAKKWKWVFTNPMLDVEPPPPPKCNPQPPTAAESATILNAAWQDDESWGVLLRIKMVTGARRGEICALRFSDFDDRPGEPSLVIKRAIKRKQGGGWKEGPTKQHEQRFVALDPQSAELLREHWRRCEAIARAIGVTLSRTAFMFSGSNSAAANHLTHLLPDSLTQRYTRLVDRLGIDTTIHKLRHFSASELIRAGVDVRTVAGRLGHGGGGTTTLKVYSAFFNEADQRAAQDLHVRLPDLPAASPRTRAERALVDPTSPNELIAVALREQLMTGAVVPGDRVPPVKEVASRHGVSVGTAHRALGLLREWKLVTGGGRGRPLLFVRPPTLESVKQPERDCVPVTMGPAGDSADAGHRGTDTIPSLRADSTGTPNAEPLELEILRLGQAYSRFRTIADPSDTAHMLALLVGAIRRRGATSTEFADFEMIVRYVGERGTIATFVPPPDLAAAAAQFQAVALPA